MIAHVALPLALLVGASNAAAGQPCDDGVALEGACVGPLTVVWCEDGETKTLQCKDGLSCKWNAQIKAFDCLGGGCKADVNNDGSKEDVPPNGMCAGPGQVFWCDGGEVKSLKCGEGFKCGWSESSGDGGAHDCIDSSVGPPPVEPGPDAGSTADASDNDDGSSHGEPDEDAVAGSDAGSAPETADDEPGDTDVGSGQSMDAGPSPNTDAGGLQPVMHHDAGPAEEVSGGGGGCQGTPGQTPNSAYGLLLLLIIGLMTRRTMLTP